MKAGRSETRGAVVQEGHENLVQYDEHTGKPCFPRKSYAIPGNSPCNKENGRNTRQSRPNDTIPAKTANNQATGMEKGGEGDKTGNACISRQREGNQG